MIQISAQTTAATHKPAAYLIPTAIHAVMGIAAQFQTFAAAAHASQDQIRAAEEAVEAEEAAARAKQALSLQTLTIVQHSALHQTTKTWQSAEAQDAEDRAQPQERQHHKHLRPATTSHKFQLNNKLQDNKRFQHSKDP